MCLCFSPSLRDCPPLPGRAREALAAPLSFTWYFDSQTCALIGVPHPGPRGGGPSGSWQMAWGQWVLHSQVLLPGLLCPHLPASLCVHFVVLEAPKGKGRPHRTGTRGNVEQFAFLFSVLDVGLDGVGGKQDASSSYWRTGGHGNLIVNGFIL